MRVPGVAMLLGWHAARHEGWSRVGDPAINTPALRRLCWLLWRFHKQTTRARRRGSNYICCWGKSRPEQPQPPHQSMVVVRANYRTHGTASRRETCPPDALSDHSSAPPRVPRRNFKYLRRNVTVGYQHCMCVMPMQCVCSICFQATPRARATRSLFCIFIAYWFAFRTNCTFRPTIWQAYNK